MISITAAANTFRRVSSSSTSTHRPFGAHFKVNYLNMSNFVQNIYFINFIFFYYKFDKFILKAFGSGRIAISTPIDEEEDEKIFNENENLIFNRSIHTTNQCSSCSFYFIQIFSYL